MSDNLTLSIKSLNHLIYHNYSNLVLVFFYNHTGIMSAKTKCIAEGSVYDSFLWFMKSKIQSGIEIRDHLRND